MRFRISIVPNGVGRSRIISANENKDYKELGSLHKWRDWEDKLERIAQQAVKDM